MNNKKKLQAVEDKLDGVVRRDPYRTWAWGWTFQHPRIHFENFYYDGPHYSLELLFFWIMYSP